MLLNLFKLQNLIFAFTMFFAAAPVFGGGGGEGAGDGGGGDAQAGDNAGAGDGSEADAGAEGDGEAIDDGSGGDAGGENSQTDPNAPVDLGNGRTVPAKIAKLFKLAKAQGLEKEVRNLYFQNQLLTKKIPGGVKDAIHLVDRVEELGGLEGIESLQSDIQTYQDDAEQFASGDPKWIETGFQENPEASLKHFNHALAVVGEQFPEHYDHVMAKVVLETLDNGSPIGAIYNLLAGLKDNPQAKAAADKLAAWYNAVKETASKLPEKKVDAREKKLTEREQQQEKREMDTRYKQVDAETFPALRGYVAKALQGEAKLKSLDLEKLADEYPGEFRSMKNEIQQEIQKLALKDQRFIDKYYALVKKGDIKRAVAHLNAKHEKIVPDVVREVAGRYGFMRGKKAAANAGNKDGKNNAGAGNDKGNANANAGWTRVNQKPANHLIDYHKTSQAMQLDGKYILKDGKQVIVHY
jgi:hypothetical protein